MSEKERLTAKGIKVYREKVLKEVEEAGAGVVTCPLLKCPLDTHKAVSPVLDHDHQSGLCRSVISLNSNSWLGRIENSWYRFCDKHTDLTLSEALRNVADYLEVDYSNNPEHPEHRAKAKRRVRRWKDETLIQKVEKEGVEVPEGVSRRKLVDLYLETCVFKEGDK